jgi:hypothetical protein
MPAHGWKRPVPLLVQRRQSSAVAGAMFLTADAPRSTGHDRRGQRSPVAPGFRGRPAADLEALEDTLVRVSYLAMHMEGHLAELDINPLMVLPSGQGVKAVDALVVLRGTSGQNLTLGTRRLQLESDP